MPTALESSASLPGANLIDPTVLARIGNLELVARSVVDGFIQGLHRAPHLGASTDFAQHREYMPGDDIRRVDWRLWGRTDRYYIKEYEADTNSNFTLILDTSRSMRYGASADLGRVSKLEYGCILGACLAYFSSQQRDRVGMATVDGGVGEFVPPSAKHLRQILQALDRTLRDEEMAKPLPDPGSSIGGAPRMHIAPTLLDPFKKLSELFRRRSIVAVISDLYEEPAAIVEAISFLRGRGNDVMVFHLLDPTELDFPFADSTNFIDLETGERLPVIPEYLRTQYREVVAAHVAELGKALRDSRVDYALFDTSKPLDSALFAYLSIRERLDADSLMNFLVPAFLAGFGALSIPVLIHMINRERKTVVQFPSLMFLHKIPYKSVRRQKIRHLLLLVIRCLALAAIVSAFARPFLKKDPAVAAGAGARDVVIVLDRSYSMAYGTRWKRAVDAAHEVVSGLGPNDRASVITFTTEPTAETDETPDHGRLNAAISKAKPSSEGTRYVPAVKLAGTMLDASMLPRKELVLISDFQQSGWAKREEVAVPPGVKLTPIDVGDVSSSDAAVISVATSRDKDTTRTHLTVTARVTNVAAKERTTDAVLEIGGRIVETQHVTIPAKGAAQVAFTPVPVPGEATRGLVRIGEDSLAPDDRFHFTIATDDAISVLIVQPAGARSTQSLFLERALAIGDRPKFKVDRVYEGDLKASDLDRRSLVIFNEATPPAGQLGTRIREMVGSGAGVLIVPGENVIERWPAEWKAFIPVTIGPVVDRMAGGGSSIGSVDYANPIFEIFSAPRSGDFSTVHVWRYRTLSPKGDSGVVARYDDGAAAMVVRREGAGKVAVWGTTLDNYWTDFPTQGVFLPFVYQLGKHVGRYTDSKGWFTAGDILDLSRHSEITAPLLGKGTRAAGDSGELVLQAPSGEKTRLSITGTNHLVPLHESGFYELRTPSTPVGGGRPIAVNVDPAEADLSHLDPKELVAAATAVPGKNGKGTEGVGTAEEQERRQTVWWFLLLAGLVLLATETVMSNRLSRVASI